MLQILFYTGTAFAIAAVFVFVLVRMGMLRGERDTTLTLHIWDAPGQTPRVEFFHGKETYEATPDQARRISRQVHELFESARNEHARQTSLGSGVTGTL